MALTFLTFSLGGHCSLVENMGEPGNEAKVIAHMHLRVCFLTTSAGSYVYTEFADVFQCYC